MSNSSKRGVRDAWRLVADLLPEVLLLGGSAAFTYGAAIVNPAAGWIVGGVLAIVAGWRLGRTAQVASHG